ncbi:MAG TPA: metallophosphoesterase family protein, partial [Caldilineaceae bacterium]|nr:metallophosphoesterase family protein [Caldilineaceae bacterium]
PRAVVARLRQVGCPVVMGNTDAWALDPHPHPIRNADSERLNAIELWGAAQLDDTDRAFIRTFQPTIELAAGSELRLLCYHGSPRSFHEGLLATTPDEQLDAALAGCTATLLAGGHTHTQMVRRHGEKLLINPGSVGQPVERVAEGVRYPPWAEFAVVEVLPGGDSGGGAGYTLSVALRRIPVDVAEVVKLAYAGGMPHAEWWVGHWR